MKTNKNRSIGIRFLNSLCAIALFAGVIYFLVSGFELVALGVVTLALVGAATPVVVAGEGFLEVLVGIFEAILEGVVAIFEAIVSALAGLFG